MKKKKDSLLYCRKGGWLAFAGLAVLIAAVCVYMAVGVIAPGALRRDITPGRIYTLSDATKGVLAALKQDVELLAVSDGTPDTGLSELLSRYAAASPHIRTRTVTTAESAYYMGAAQAEGSVIVTNGQYEQAHDPSTFTRAVYEERQVVDQVYCTESLITNSIAYVTADLPLACVMLDHGETALDPGFLDVLAATGYHVHNLYLSEKNELPEGCALIVCNLALADLGDEETETVLSFLEQGGGFVLVTSGQVISSMPNLMRVAAAAGMAPVQGVVMEMDSMHVYSADYPYYLLPEKIEGEITALSSQFGIPVLMSQAHAIESAGEDASFISLLETTSSSYIKTNVYQNGVLAYADGDRTGPFCVAAVGETASGGKVFWMPSPQCLSDSVNAMVYGANYILASSAIEWMENGAPLETIPVETRSVMQNDAVLSGQPVLTAALIALPAAALLAGVIAALRRRKAAKAD